MTPILTETVSKQPLVVRYLGQQEYLPCWQAMQAFTDQRDEETPDELWLLEHPPIFTLGQSGSLQHVLQAGKVPVLQIDRGGQVTYHGPGQLVAYTLIDIKRKKLSIRQFVTQLEQSVIDLLAQKGIIAEGRCKAPGVYVDNKKICSIGLRVRRGHAFHGLALNVAMDLTPFSYINPCGHAGLEMTQLSELNKDSNNVFETGKEFVRCLANHLGYSEII